MTAADYAAIAVAPLLIFLMISSLANFLMLVFYQGPHPLRVAWIVLMFTMGFVGIARIAIEQDRAYSLGYAFVLGCAGFLSMTRFVGSPIFCAFILAVIAYLADRIVDDCTLIDDSVDSSGQGLVDFGRKAVKKQIKLAKEAQRQTADAETTDQLGCSPEGADLPDQQKSGFAPTQVPAPSAGGGRDGQRRGRRGRKSQPGRTVMYLALAALPLFGLGQFMLRDDALSWQRAQWLLAIYLFSSFSLLVTTSFLGLRRYLRQRGVDMPANVSIGWLAGGVIMTGAIISLAYLLPMPGQAIASVQMSDWLDSPEDFNASRFGWGKEAANESKEGDASTGQDDNTEGKQTQGVRPEEGAPKGDSGDGKRDDGPAGKQDGGEKNGGQQETSDSEGDSKNGKPSSEDNEGSRQQQKNKPADGQQEPQSESKQTESDNQNPKQTETDSNQDSAADEASEKDAGEGRHDRENASHQDEAESQEKRDSGSSRSSSPPPSNPSSMLRGLMAAIGSLFKFVLVVVLACIVGVYLWMHRDAILRWWNSLFDRDTPGAMREKSSAPAEAPPTPPRPFASFENPIGREQDPRRVMVITFQAFEAWTREQGWSREQDETPSEFMRRVAGSLPHVSSAATSVVDAYNRIVYGRGSPTRSDIDAAKAVWQAMNA